ncbi:MAG: bifunctional [glutamine synthetase] adenylyltransferase/[glutamine synthetase]-adenylyl-L-tyrosine phosphorylase [Rhodopila sp.]|nr:bifunctional [glutamine synthetase] adenylyltransferase/[glutamine synthetase]-adenylyl-L-tyrosine phosphorylase [Rhodopila sp.]
MKPLPFVMPRHWPAPYDEAAADRLVERFQAIGETEARLVNMPGVLPMLRCLGGNSPYLAALALRESESIDRLVTEGPDAALAHNLSGLSHISPAAKRPDIAARLRQAKRATALIAAIADVGGIWPLETVTGALSELAETSLRLAIRHLLRTAHDSGDIRLQDVNRPDFNCGFVALAMGKLGASELNYSSDIDLILLYDGTAPVYAAGRAEDNIGSFTSRLARDLITLMEARDANGYVFRTDLRLRPDPAATPPAVSLHAALIYYETMGQNWERAAMIKARPVAGDLSLGDRFLEAIRPFVWRRGLDFAAVADIHAMKRRIDVEKKTALGRGDDPVARIAGHNVKLGEGGIREIEFLVQTLQMVWGGRDPTLRIKPTVPALRRLMETGHLSEAARLQLEDSYRFLRQVEHRIQMVNDRQTHSLPEQPDEMDRIAQFMGYADTPAFASSFLRHVNIVRANYRAVFEHVPDVPGTQAVGPELDFRGDDPEPSVTVAALHSLGYQDAKRIITAVRQWLTGRVRALRSSRARDLMTTMVPSILVTLGRQANPDEAFNRFDRFINALPVGVQPMSLFQRNPMLLDRIAAVLGAAPMLSEHLARYPNSIEGLLSTEDVVDARHMLRSRMTDATRLEDVIQVVRRAVKERDFFLSVATLEGRLDVNASGRQRTALAEAALSMLVPRVLADFATRFGRVPGGKLAVVAMGKAGGREMMAGSDLDLMFIYNHPADATESRGARSLPTSQWFVRAVQACISALTAPGPEGQMYALDMRLRPSGNKGPIAVSLESFKRYHAQDAWTWERMALTRARVVAGPTEMRARVQQAIEAAIRRPQDPAQIRTNATSMRSRMIRELRPQGPWDVKLRAGGLIDIEFIAQVLQLVHVGDMGFRRSETTHIALRRLSEAGAIARPDACLLINAERLWRTIQGMLRMTVGRVEGAVLPHASSVPLLHAAARAGVSAVDSEELLHKSDAIAQQVRTLFERYVGKTDG